MIPIASPKLDQAEEKQILKVLESGMLAAGEQVENFQSEFADFVGTERAIAVANGTCALDVAVKASDLSAGDKVITTAFTFIASSNALLFNDIEPVFVDIDPETFNIDPEAVRKAAEEHPEAAGIMAVHLFGLLADMEEIMDIAAEHDLTVIEDAAQAHGAALRGKKAGSFGDAGIFSFYPTKNMTTGEGGMIVTSDEEMAQKAARLINHGRSDHYKHEVLGYNYRMTDLAAAIGRKQLEKLPNFNQQRRRNALYLNHNLQELDWLKVPDVDKKYYHVYHQYTVRVPADFRQDFIDHLEEKGVGSGIYYPRPLYRQPVYEKRGYGDMQLAETEQACREVLSLPVHPGVSDEDLEQIAAAVRSFER